MFTVISGPCSLSDGITCYPKDGDAACDWDTCDLSDSAAADGHSCAWDREVQEGTEWHVPDVCVRSPNFPSSYGDNEDCMISVSRGGFIRANSFDVSGRYTSDILVGDFLQIMDGNGNGTSYSGARNHAGHVYGYAHNHAGHVYVDRSKDLARGVVVSPGDVIQWHGRASGSRGFEICGTLCEHVANPRTAGPNPNAHPPSLCPPHSTCSRDGASCVCTEGWTGASCLNPPEGWTGWRMQEFSGPEQTCTTTCNAIHRSCVNGDWGVHDEQSMVKALASAGLNASTWCTGYSFAAPEPREGDRWELDTRPEVGNNGERGLCWLSNANQSLVNHRCQACQGCPDSRNCDHLTDAAYQACQASCTVCHGLDSWSPAPDCSRHPLVSSCDFPGGGNNYVGWDQRSARLCKCV